jgi:leucyl aminopeptidase
MPSAMVEADALSPDAIIIPLRLTRSDDPLPTFAKASGFRAAVGTICPMPDTQGNFSEILVGIGSGDDFLAAGDLSRKLPAGLYAWAGQAGENPLSVTALTLGWLLGAYRFERYKTTTQTDSTSARLCWSLAANRVEIEALGEATALVRDLINTPAADLGPAELEDVARRVADAGEASFRSIVGEDLLSEGYLAIYAVGASSPRAPRLLDFTWGDPAAPKVTIVGKGVVFDTGGLDIKPASAMKLMKKDMGGAAHALGLALLVMRHRLPVRLRVLIPVAENAVSGTAMRPGDILATRKGLTIEVNNTDAEGRLILADALCEGDREDPAVLIDFATLTGAARVALGADIPALFCNEDSWADSLMRAGMDNQDPLWRLPLWPGYRSMVEGRVGDLDNAPEGGMAGAITAALFLERFVSASTPWAHIDTYGWSPKGRPAHPVGGDALGMRAVFAALRDRFG